MEFRYKRRSVLENYQSTYAESFYTLLFLLIHSLSRHFGENQVCPTNGCLTEFVCDNYTAWFNSSETRTSV
ncbi:hypothetical protein EG68_02589 [Paragonimus skrjabini miyazakii]|uniref:Uncharacterized protein n=1 Tax=Paragonimus skrjabini miyazakii TaxID=59628 RepID=A0A8S9YY03_9TREM|nr:hypothetical protein EG68_02589 [Paragonimus skrjabini miyazakii]